jgi:hypothetical protein
MMKVNEKRTADSRPDDEFTVTIRRGDLSALFSALEIATDTPAAVVTPVIGTTQRMAFLKVVIRLREQFQAAVLDHDGVPKSQRGASDAKVKARSVGKSVPVPHVDYKTTDYCVTCGESPDSGSHLPGGHAYVPPY